MTAFPTLWRRPSQLAFRRSDELANRMQRFFEEALDNWPAIETQGDLLPAVNVAEDQKAMTVTIELAGFDEKDIQVNATKNLLTISGERKWEQEKQGRKWHRVESQYGSFTRTLTLPANVKADQIEAIFQKGILTLTLPKVEPTPTTQVKIKVQ